MADVGVSSGKQRAGQHYDQRNDFVSAFTEQVMARAEAEALVGNNRTEVIPKDDLQALVRVYTPPTAAIEAYKKAMGGYENIRLPDILTAINVHYNTTEMNGSGSHSAGTLLGLGPASFTLDPTSTCQSSAGVTPTISVEIQQLFNQNLPVTYYFFYVLNEATTADILTKLAVVAGAAVTAWPIFKPQSHTISAHGQSCSISQTAEAQERCSFSATKVWQYQFSDGSSVQKSAELSTQSIRFGPVIHGLINVGGEGTSMTKHALTAVAVSIPAINSTVPDPPITLSAIINAPSGVLQAVTGSVTPTSFAATSPAAYPATGLYLYDAKYSDTDWGYTLVTATVFDFASIA